jgi:hypothetical protein
MPRLDPLSVAAARARSLGLSPEMDDRLELLYNVSSVVRTGRQLLQEDIGV